MAKHSIIVVMGVSGSGKSTIGAMLAGELGWQYAEADDFHSAANVEKMAQGHPLTDEDRWPWLHAIGAWIDIQITAEQPAVVTCSALKHAYRDLLRRPHVKFVYLEGSRELIQSRLTARQGHFFRAELLDSQFADLEEPTADENVLTIAIGGTPRQVVDEIISGLDGDLASR
ncbi:gluconokinase [Rugosimonospora acidiphila]|uniref:Gluconokinase n=1 Tax=Rugosimonospora acidiphila TaxID=556531 RepID=A0ABP9RNC4_9ACTN